MSGGRRLIQLFLVAALVIGAAPSSTARQGVTKNRIKIGVHIPMTGASPIDSDPAVKGARLLWRWLRIKDKRIHGRNVRVVVRNDQSNPAEAVAVCREMVEENHVFLLSGMPSHSGGGDQMESCARYAASVGVPYVSIGASERHDYFAVTMSLSDQGPLLADYLLDARGARQAVNGIVWHDTPLYSGAHDRFVMTMGRRGAEVAYDRAVPANSGTSEARTIVREMQVAGVTNVVIMTTPIFTLNVLQQAASAGFQPLWTGPGITLTQSDDIPQAVCANSDHNVRFFSAVPAFIDRDDFDRTYDRAVQRVYSEAGGAMTWQGWATSKVLRSMLRAGGKDLTRRRFTRRVENMKPIRNGTLPVVRFAPDDHFGGRGTHVLKMDCTVDAWRTVRTFVRNFGGGR